MVVMRTARRNKSKKGQSASGAAVLIALIGLFIVLYVLFLPADIREDLLEDDLYGYEDQNSTDDDDGVDVDERTLLRENPGRMYVLDALDCSGTECTHEINSFVLFKTTESSEIEDFNPFIVRNNIMTKKDYENVFDILDLEHTDNLFLTFNAEKNEGILTIKLNGNIIFERDLDTFNPDPIELQKGILSSTNKLEFSVSQVGWEFWKSNEYRIENVRIIGDITDVSRQKSTNVFYISDTEYQNLERARLKFSPNCNQGTVGVLEVMLNSRLLYSGVPDCEMLNEISFAPEKLEKGENELVFISDRGSYSIDLIQVRTDLKDVDYPVYYFDLKEEDLEHIEDEYANLTISMEFVDHDFVEEYDEEYGAYNGQKSYRAVLTVNGHKIYVNSKDEDYKRSISYEVLREDDNWVKIEPRTGMIEVSQLLVDVVED